MDNWIKVVAVFGPVAGIIVGALGQWLMQWYFVRHSDKTRFHQLRVYSKFLQNANRTILNFLEGKIDDSDLDTVVYLASQIALIASNEVRTHVANINETIRKIAENIATVTQHQPTYQNQTRSFIEAARNELT